jgi:hypothetical protein
MAEPIPEAPEPSLQAKTPSALPIKRGSGLAADQEPARAVKFEVVDTGERRREGRPTKLTEARFKRILEHIRACITSIKAVAP